MKNVIDEMQERKVIYQSIDLEKLHEILGREKVVCYAGFDPTSDSLHIGHLASILQLVRMQKAGHTPIALIGGATGRIGDPTGRNDMRPMIDEEKRNDNVQKIKAQISGFFDPNCSNRLVVVNNDDWFKNMNYIDFLNTVGLNMSVNKMLSSGCFEQRMVNGLSFLEFNYMPMQAYDFYYLYKNYNCTVELGGSDQWANIVAGVDLIRHKDNASVFCLTTPLLTKADGSKMGKSQGGAVWLAREKFSDYDLFQVLRNVDDSKVEEWFNLLTLLPVEEIKSICSVTGKDINSAKERLAYEVVSLVRGVESANEALRQARGAFLGEGSEMLEKHISIHELNIVDVLLSLGFATSRGDAKKLILGGGIKVNDKVINEFDYQCPKENFVIKKGKKNIVRVIVK